MSQQHFDNWSEMAQKVQEPIKALTELNIKTLQNFSYLKPDDLMQTKKPEEMLEKQINLLVENGHKTLDYFHQSFLILEKSMLNLVREAKQTVEKKKA